MTALVSGGFLLVLSTAALGINLSVPVTANLADSGPGRAGLTTLTQAGIPSGTLAAFDVYVPPGTRPDAVAARIRAMPGVNIVAAPLDAEWRRDGSAVITVLPTEEGGTSAGQDTIRAVIDRVPDGVLVGGNATQQQDSIDAVYQAFPGMLALVGLITFVMLARAFRSLVLPVKAIVLNLLSLGAVLGAMVLLWQWGWGADALLGRESDGAIGALVPVTVFAFLYGLSMDYEVFVVARMREEYDRSGSTREAVVVGIGRSGRLVICAALILFFSFASVAAGGASATWRSWPPASPSGSSWTPR